MKNQIYLFLVFILFISISCQKKDEFENKTIIEGYILEYGSEEPLVNLPIYLLELESSEIFGSQVWRTIDSVFTDENGYVYYEFNHNEMTIDLCSFSQSDKHFEIEEKVVNSRQINDISQLADPHAWIKIHVLNVNLVDGTDLIDVTGPWGGGGLDNVFYGSMVNVIIKEKIRGKRNTSLSWFVRKNGVESKLRDTIYTAAHDTTFYQILY